MTDTVVWAVQVVLAMAALSALCIAMERAVVWFGRLVIATDMEDADGPLEMLDTRPSLADSSGRLRWASDDDLSRVRADFKARLARQQASEAKVHQAVNAIRRSR